MVKMKMKKMMKYCAIAYFSHAVFLYYNINGKKGILHSQSSFTEENK